jgi:hypothetical protein
VTEGSSHYGSTSFSGGTAADIVRVIITKAPWLVFFLGEIAAEIVDSYDRIIISWRIRYKEEGDLYYYERVTNIYGDGSRIAGPYTDRGKSY